MAEPDTAQSAYYQRALEALRAATDNLTQGHLETAVNRAYYACFYAVHSVLQNLNLIATSHKQTGILFRKHFIATGKMDKKFNRTWESLQKYRMDADYDPLPIISREKTASLIDQAKEFVDTLFSIPANPA